MPVLINNSSSGNPVSVPGGAVPHHASAPIHHAYPQPSVAPTAPPPGSTVPHGVNSVSSTSGAPVSVIDPIILFVNTWVSEEIQYI